MNRSETATITIPLRVWGRLASQAEYRGVKVADLLVEAIEIALGKRAREVIGENTLAARVAAAIRDGLPDQVIARRLGVTLESVRMCRRGMGLKPVKFVRDRWPELMERKAS